MEIGKLIKRILSLFKSNSELWQGVPLINIYCLRLLYTLMFLVLGKDVWTYIFTHTGGWEPNKAMSFSVWASFSLLAFLGILQPLKLLPILLLEIAYKLIWLIIVAYPLWLSGNLEVLPRKEWQPHLPGSFCQSFLCLGNMRSKHTFCLKNRISLYESI